MPSESARAASASEARFRIDAPNSQPRRIKVIALDHASEAVVKSLAKAEWQGASFLTIRQDTPRRGESFSMKGWLADLAGGTKDLVDEIAAADQVVMVATAGENAEAASIIGEAASLKRVMTTALVICPQRTSDEALSQTLARLRPWSLMLVVSAAKDYINDMLTALRA